MTDAAAFGEWLRSRRRAAGFSQEELAERSDLSTRAVRNLERGRIGCPRRGSLRRLADALDLQGQARAQFLAAGRRQSPAAARSDPAPPPGSWPGVPRPLPLVVPRQLPATVRHFTGRNAALAQLNALLGAARAGDAAVVVAAIDGGPGVGKTALAVRWAHEVAAEFPDGQLYINLRGFDPSGEAVAAETAIRVFLDAFGIRPEQAPSSPQSQAGLYRSLLAGKRVLIVADNARDAGQVRPLLPGSPGCLVVVTSRARLTGLVAREGAHPLTLNVLPACEARELLARRVGAGRARAEPTAIDELARLCGWLPLALTVAAARAAARPGMSLTALAAELASAADRLRTLETGDPVTDLRTVFSWSCRQLDELPARMFRLLGIHPGPDITSPAAAALLAVRHDDARAALDTLATANLIDEHAPGRFALHDLLRAYAAEQAAKQEGRTGCLAAMQRVLDYYLHTAHAAALLLAPSREPIALAPARPGVVGVSLGNDRQAMAWFEAEHQVLVAATALAAATGLDAYAWQLPWAMADFLDRGGHWQEWAATERTALASATRLGDPAGQAVTRRLLAHACAQLGDYDQARAHLTDCLGIYQRLGDRLGQARTHQSLGVMAARQGRHAEALVHDQQTLDLVRATGDQARLAAALANVGYSHAQLGDYQQAQAFCRQALGLHRQLDYAPAEAHAWDSLGYAEHKLGNLIEAADCYTRALGIFRDLSDRYGEAGTLTELGDVRNTAGDQQQARDAWQQALDILEDLRHPDAAQVRAKLCRHQ
jgi:tetratricopeptide (TPR) repeat protein